MTAAKFVPHFALYPFSLRIFDVCSVGDGRGYELADPFDGASGVGRSGHRNSIVAAKTGKVDHAILMDDPSADSRVRLVVLFVREAQSRTAQQSDLSKLVLASTGLSQSVPDHLEAR